MSEIVRAIEDRRITDAARQLIVSGEALATAQGRAIVDLLLRLHARRSGPNTDVVWRQGAARVDYEDNPALGIGQLMTLHDLTANQVNRAIGKVGVSGAIYRAAEDHRILRRAAAQDDLALESNGNVSHPQSSLKQRNVEIENERDA